MTLESLCLAGFLLIQTPPSAATLGQEQEEILTNESVVSLVKAGLPAGTVILKIRSSRTRFDTSTAGILRLTQQKVPAEVIEAMMQSSSASAQMGSVTSGNAAPVWTEPEVFLEQGGADELERMEKAPYTSKFSYGIFSGGFKVVVPGKHARVQTGDRRPVFQFRLPDGQTPQSFILSRFEGSDEGGGRQLDDESKVNFDVEPVSPGEFRVTVRKELKKGEYCFYRGVVGDLSPYGYGYSEQLSIYDFGVTDEKRK